MKTFLESSFVTALISWFIAQVIKVIVVMVVERRIDLGRFVGAGGMPSSHSAFVSSLAAAVGIINGFSSEIFAVSAALALVVMYDAAGVRRAAGEHAKLLNEILQEWAKQDFKNTDVQLKELLGHTPLQVVAGALLGIVIAILRHI